MVAMRLISPIGCCRSDHLTAWSPGRHTLVTTLGWAGHLLASTAHRITPWYSYIIFVVGQLLLKDKLRTEKLYMGHHRRQCKKKMAGQEVTTRGRYHVLHHMRPYRIKVNEEQLVRRLLMSTCPPCMCMPLVTKARSPAAISAHDGVASKHEKLIVCRWTL